MFQKIDERCNLALFINFGLFRILNSVPFPRQTLIRVRKSNDSHFGQTFGIHLPGKKLVLNF